MFLLVLMVAPCWKVGLNSNVGFLKLAIFHLKTLHENGVFMVKLYIHIIHSTYISKYNKLHLTWLLVLLRFIIDRLIRNLQCFLLNSRVQVSSFCFYCNSWDIDQSPHSSRSNFLLPCFLLKHFSFDNPKNQGNLSHFWFVCGYWLCSEGKKKAKITNI